MVSPTTRTTPAAAPRPISGKATIVDDGIDNDDDGAIDDVPPGWPLTGVRDRGCANANSQTESPQCNDGVDNDNDGKTDLVDPQCAGSASNNRESAGCGLGAELALALPLIAEWRRRRVARRH